MKQSASQFTLDGSEAPVNDVGTRPQPKTREKAGTEALSARGRHEEGHTYVYAPASLWSNLMYGLGTLAVLVIPPLIPGVTTPGLIMGYIAALVIVFTVVCVWGMVRSLYSRRGRS
jgi:hypothetical protein